MITADMRIAVAGAAGYAGSHMTSGLISLARRMEDIEEIILHDPNGIPAELKAEGLVRVVSSSRELLESKADIYHLALHPKHRNEYLEALLPSGAAILCEKPMSGASSAGRCEYLIRKAGEHDTILLCNYILPHSRITERILDFLTQYDDLAIQSFEASFQKNRESRHPMHVSRNSCVMETIEIQEVGHPLALFLYIMAKVYGKQTDFASLFPNGASIKARSKPYDPPNPRAYSHVVNGYIDGEISTEDTRIGIMVNFKRFDGWNPTQLEKKILIKGRGNGRQFTIEADYLPGAEYLIIDGVRQELGKVAAYEDIWSRTLRDFRAIMDNKKGTFIDANFAHLVYQLGMAMWFSASQRGEIYIGDARRLSEYPYAYPFTNHKKYSQGILRELVAEPAKRIFDMWVDHRERKAAEKQFR